QTGATGTTSLTVNFSDRPTAVIASPTQGAPGAGFTLDATQSTQPQGHPLAYGWRQLEGDAVTLSSTSAAKPAFVAPAVEQRLTFAVTVTDTQSNLSASAS